MPDPISPDGKPLTLDQALVNLHQTEDTGLRYYAAWWIGKMRVRSEDAIAGLLLALQDEADRAPDGGYPLRRNAARALGKVGGPESIPHLINCLQCEDYYVRETAAQALELLGDPSCISALVDLLAGGLEAALPVPGKPHLVQPYNAILETLGTLGSQVGDQSLVEIIAPFIAHETVQVRNAAARALYQLTGQTHYAEQLVNILRGDQLQLRRSALMDLGAIGYLPAADMVAQTLAENSMKLISLQGILECQLKVEQDQDILNLSEQTQHVMALMDGLL
jgi:phycocyanobilin lyase subunit alpha